MQTQTFKVSYSNVCISNKQISMNFGTIPWKCVASFYFSPLK